MSCLGRLLCMPAVYRRGRIIHNTKRVGVKVTKGATKLFYSMQSMAKGPPATSMEGTSSGVEDEHSVYDRPACSTQEAGNGEPNGIPTRSGDNDPITLLACDPVQLEELSKKGFKITEDEWNTRLLSQCRQQDSSVEQSEAGE